MYTEKQTVNGRAGQKERKKEKKKEQSGEQRKKGWAC